MVWLNRPDLVLPLDISLNFVKLSNYHFIQFFILKQGTQCAFDLLLSFQKIQEKLSTLLKSALKDFEKLVESPTHFSKAIR